MAEPTYPVPPYEERWQRLMRIRLISTTDPITDLKAGAEGTVVSVKQSNWLGFIDHRLEVEWDNGSTLALFESQDKWEVISE